MRLEQVTQESSRLDRRGTGRRQATQNKACRSGRMQLEAVAAKSRRKRLGERVRLVLR
jgi:hypothetical protein